MAKSKDTISIKLTKDQWEEVYQWYLCVKNDYRIEEFEKNAAKTICESIFGENSFKE